MLFQRLSPLLIFFFALLCPALCSERINPAGIQGAIILSSEPVNDESLQKFYDFSGKEPKIIILLLDGSETSRAHANTIQEKVSQENVKDSKLLTLESDKVQENIQTATGLWLVGQGPQSLKNCKYLDSIKSLINRRAVLGAGGQIIEGFGISGTDIFPGAEIRHSTAKESKQKRGTVRYDFSKGSSLILIDRAMRLLGEGEISISLAASDTRKEKKIILNEESRVADLTALRFAATARNGSEFPPQKISDPRVEKGTLIIIGGGPMPRSVTKRFIQIAGGNQASIVVLPTAVPDSMVKDSGFMANAFRKFGAKEVTVLSKRTLSEVDGDEYLQILKRATGIWFGGGRQWRFVDAYHDTKALGLMHDVLKKGGVIMGSSAGASIQAEYLVRGNPLGNQDMMAEGYEKGLGFLKGVAIDQHFAERDRFKDLASVVDRFPQILGIGIDEGTALIVKGPVGLVQGKGQVHFYNRRRETKGEDKDYESVGSGGRYQLVQRKVLNLGKVEEKKD
ncbi:MAG: cyanophycinase [Verrucomicrobiales bacterium]|nr:cyanophycinase [Verrucomicrobiales bacterium]